MTDLINGRTPEEIKAAIEHCKSGECTGCSYQDCMWCEDQIYCDALDLIKRLEQRIAKQNNLLAVLGVSIPKGDDL